MTIDEAKNVGKMSEAGKKAYAEAYAMEAMASSQSDPKQQAKNENAKNMYELLQAQQTIMNKTSTIDQKIANLYAPIQNDPERQKMLDRIDAWNSKIMSMTGIDYGQGEQMDSLGLLIKNEKIKYCDKFTPRQRAATRQHYQILKASIPDYLSYGEIMSNVNKTQLGITVSAECQEIASLSAILGYLKALQGVYSYKIYYFEDNN